MTQIPCFASVVALAAPSAAELELRRIDEWAVIIDSPRKKS